MDIITEVLVERPPAEVFALLADYRRDGEWRRAVTAMRVEPDAPVVVGSTISETLRFAGRTWITDTTVTALQPGRSLCFQGGDATMQVSGRREVEPWGDGTRVRQQLTLEPRGLLRLLSPLLAAMYRRVATRDLATLRDLLQRSPAAV